MYKYLACSALLSIGCTLHGQGIQTGLKTGDIAPDITLTSPDGEELSLYKIAHKSLVIVDMWASWCGPCRRANPSLVKFYNDYKDYKYEDARKGLKMVSISLDKSKDKWIKAIETDSLYWPWHMSDLKGWSSAAAKAYNVRFIPQCFLMDETGKVLGAYRNAAEAREILDQRVKKKSWWQKIFS